MRSIFQPWKPRHCWHWIHTHVWQDSHTHTHMHDIHKRCRQTFEIHKYPYLCVSIYVRAHVEYVHVDTVYAFAHVINARKTHTHIYIYICTNICVICGCDLCLHGHQVEARCFAWCMHSASLWLKLELILRNVKKSIGLLSILLDSTNWKVEKASLLERYMIYHTSGSLLSM